MRSSQPYVLLTFLALSLASCSTRQSYDVANYRDDQFWNQNPGKEKSFFGYLKMRMSTDQADWPEQVPLKRASKKPLKRWSQGLRVTAINHSTFLLQLENLNILTDPIFSERASPLTWAGPKRVIAPGIQRDDLPTIDVVVISHDHYDHLDIDFLRWIYQRDQPKIFFGLGVGRVFDSGEQYQEFQWNESQSFQDFEFTFLPAQHFSGRTLFDRNSTLWGAWAIRSPNGIQIYHAGDSGYSDHFKQAQENFEYFDLAMIPIGAYAPRDFMSYAHVDPKQAVAAHKDLNSKMSLGMHWGTFQLTNEPRSEPKELLNQMKSEDPSLKFQVAENTDCYILDEETWSLCDTSSGPSPSTVSEPND